MIARALLYCLLAGLVFAVARAQSLLPSTGLAWLWLEGLLFSGALFAVARWGPQTRLKLFAVVWLILAIVAGVCLQSEALIFTTFSLPQVLAFLRDDLLAFTAFAIAFALLAGPLRLSESAAAPAPPRHRFPSLAGRVGVSGLAYVVFYFVFGGIFYTFFTRPYYQDPTLPLRAGEQTIARLGLWFPLIQLGRGTLMTASSLPLIFTLRLNRWTAGITLGIILWVVGGLGPLLVAGAVLPLKLRLYHIFEILFQLGGLGLVAVWLLRPKSESQ